MATNIAVRSELVKRARSISLCYNVYGTETITFLAKIKELMAALLIYILNRSNNGCRCAIVNSRPSHNQKKVRAGKTEEKKAICNCLVAGY